jgi:hypothetical protein
MDMSGQSLEADTVSSAGTVSRQWLDGASPSYPSSYRKSLRSERWAPKQEMHNEFGVDLWFDPLAYRPILAIYSLCPK